MNRPPLMPKATAVWLVDNTPLSFEQIGKFCGLHPLEVQAIADGEVAQGIVGLDPVGNGQLTRAELERCIADKRAELKMNKAAIELPKLRGKGGKYTPVSRRADRPNAIAWLVRNHPELTDAQVVKLVGTTKHTIAQVRDRTHWNASNIKPQDPVALGLCTQIDLDNAVGTAARRVQKEAEAKKASRPAPAARPAPVAAEPEEPDAPEPPTSEAEEEEEEDARH